MHGCAYGESLVHFGLNAEFQVFKGFLFQAYWLGIVSANRQHDGVEQKSKRFHLTKTMFRVGDILWSSPGLESCRTLRERAKFFAQNLFPNIFLPSRCRSSSNRTKLEKRRNLPTFHRSMQATCNSSLGSIFLSLPLCAS